jgi:hypothetical protein
MHQDSVWTVEVVDGAGRPLPIDGASLTFVARTLPGTIREPRPDELHVQDGRVVVHALPPGRWALHVDVARSLGAVVEWTIAAPRSTQRSRVVIEPLDGGALGSSAVEPTADGLPWVADVAGLAPWTSIGRIALAETRRDRAFAATLRSGFGAIHAAELVLDLRAVQSMCSNDSLSLERTGAGFVWQRAIRDLVRGQWKDGARARVRIDLTRLPLADGTTLDLREHLADGMLDVLIQDDTAVDGAWLRVVR